MAVFINIRDYQERLNLRRNRIFRLHPLDAYSDSEIIRRYRLSRPLIIELYEDIAHEIEPQSLRSHAIQEYAAAILLFTLLQHRNFPSCHRGQHWQPQVIREPNSRTCNHLRCVGLGMSTLGFLLGKQI
jgi:hypothetical protein